METKHRLQQLIEDGGYECHGTSATSEEGRRIICLSVTCPEGQPLGLHDLTEQERQLFQDCETEWVGPTTIHRWPRIPFTPEHHGHVSTRDGRLYCGRCGLGTEDLLRTTCGQCGVPL